MQRLSYHLNDGQLRAYSDGELDGLEREKVKAHLADCGRCQEKAELLLARSDRVSMQIDTLAHSAAPTPLGAARTRLSRYIVHKESSNMSKIFSRRYRMAWAAAALVLILAVSMAFPSVRAIANDFLGLFRVRQFTVIQVNPGNLPEQLGSSSKLEAMFSKDIKIEDHGKVQEANSRDEAVSLAGFPIKLPAGLDGTPTLVVQPGASMSFKVDMQQVSALLNEIGRADIQLPASLDGATISVEVPKGITAMYGDCKFDLEKAQAEGYDPDSQTIPSLPRCTTLLQMPSPTVSAPEGLDLQKIGAAYLEVLGMSRQDAEHFAQNIDWSSTLVIPIPRYRTTYSDVTVDGVPGTLIRQDGGGRTNQYMLIWVKNSIIYALTGPGNNATALEIAASLK